MDQMGEVEYAPGEPKGTPWHPHRGFETVTYIIDGMFEHQDTQGGGGQITNGDTQWMTAGSGLLHIEAPPEHLVASGGLFHGLQLWVNLPRAEQDDRPPLPGHPGRRGAAAGQPRRRRAAAGHRRRGGRAPGARHHPHAHHDGPRHHRPGRPARAALARDLNALAYVLAGDGRAGSDRRPVHTGQTVVFGAGDQSCSARTTSRTAGTRPRRASSSAAGPSASRSPDTARS